MYNLVLNLPNNTPKGKSLSYHLYRPIPLQVSVSTQIHLHLYEV
jgi:hypothetical protein